MIENRERTEWGNGGMRTEIYRLSDMLIGDGMKIIHRDCPDNSASIPISDSNRHCFGSLVSSASW